MTLRKYVWMGAAAGALVIAAQASAADLNGGFKDSPRAFQAPMWTGLYLGVNGGYAWRQTDDQFSYPAGVGYDAFGGIGADGGFGGGQIGYSWQGFLGMPLFVAGIEADIQGADIQGSGTASGTNPAWAESYKANLDWFGTVRGRLGYAAGPALLYFTGGFAFGGLKQHAEDATTIYPDVATYDGNSTVTGYVLGGGIEYKFNPSWSLKAEYQYLNFGKNDISTTAAAVNAGALATMSSDGYKIGDDAFHTVRVGLNYWVSPAYAPLK
jgi:outer membrane immunogenic protein